MTEEHNDKRIPFEGQKLAWSINTIEYPGKVEVEYITFHKKFITVEEFKSSAFVLVNRNEPRFRKFLELMNME